MGVNGDGIVFLNTPQAAGQANVESNNPVTGRTITNIQSDATTTNPMNLSPPTPITVPTITTALTVSAASVKVQVSSAFSGRRPNSPRTSHLAKSSKPST